MARGGVRGHIAAMVETHKEMAARHVATGRVVIARQRDLIANQHRKGRSTVIAENLLERFLSSQAIFEADLAEISKRDRSS